MNCDFIEKYETGKIEESQFQVHLKKCAFCQRQISGDEKLLAISRSLKQPVTAPDLWGNIEKSLIAEKNKEQKFRRGYFPVLRIAAVLLLVFGLTILFLNKSNHQKSKLLTGSVLEKVEQKEMELENAISALEKIARPKLPTMDLELMFLYRDRLETIQAQIVQCKEMLDENPANAHLRRYLLAAYRDKKETLKELIDADQL